MSYLAPLSRPVNLLYLRFNYSIFYFNEYRILTTLIKFLDISTIKWYHTNMSSKHQKTLESIFRNPIQANIFWSDIESLFSNLGAELSEGAGSRLRVKLNGARAVFHRPHPQKTTDRGAVNSVRRFLENAGVKK
jgi:hypothetical protein